MKFDTYKLPNGTITARPARNGKSDINHLLQEMTKSTTLTKADGLAVITFIRDYLIRELGRGTTVNIDGLGQFGISLRLMRDIEEGKLTGNDIEMKRITFKAAPSFKNEVAETLHKVHVEKSERNASKPRHNIDERRAILQRMIDSMEEFTAEEYRNQTCVSNMTAHYDLKRFVQEGVLQSRYIGHTKLYSAKKMGL